MEKTNYKSVKWLLLSLNLCDYTHISIREHTPGSTKYLGGGKPGDIIRRYGDREVCDSCILDNILCLYVAPEDPGDACTEVDMQGKNFGNLLSK